MSIVSYLDDNVRLGETFIQKNYSNLAKEIKEKKSEYTFRVDKNDRMIAFDVSKNQALSKIYKNDFYVVRLVLADVDTFHSIDQESIFCELYKELNEYMNQNPGYYNLRIPIHIVDAIRAYNLEIKDSIFCGGTVELIAHGLYTDIDSELKIFWADRNYIEENREKLLEISFESFKEYQGQYHISPVTEEKAGLIYEQWLAACFSDYKENVVVATYNKVPVAFVMLEETNNAIEVVLGAVDKRYRQFGAYRLLSGYAMNYATENGKSIVASTQLDNYFAQRAWLALGLRPFYSIYNVHIDKRRSG